MIYLQTNNHHDRKRRAQIVTGVFLIIIIIIIALIQLFLPHLFPAIAMIVASPFWRAEFAIESGALKSPQSLLAENESLKLQLQDADARLLTIHAIEQENIDLKAFFGRNVNVSSTSSDESSSSLAYSSFIRMVSATKLGGRILSPVLMGPGIGAYDELIIDGGSDMNFEIGDKVYIVGDILIGSISDVLPKTSKVSLLSSPGNILGVLVGPYNVSATAVGRGGGQYFAQVPRTAKITEGDFVIIPSIDDRPFGVISAVENDPTQSFETVLFAAPLNPYEIRWVFVDGNGK